MEVKFEVRMNTKKMFHFLMYHIYHSFQGPLSLLFAAAGIGVCIWTYGDVAMNWTVLYAFFGILFLIYEPVSLYLKAATQVKLNPVFKKPLTYVMNEKGIVTMQGEQKAEIQWEDLRSIKESISYFFCYTSRQNAFIFPKKDFQDQSGDAQRLLREKKEILKTKRYDDKTVDHEQEPGNEEQTITGGKIEKNDH